MKTKETSAKVEDVSVLMVGNNPTDLGRIFDSLNHIPGRRIITEIAFDLKTILERLGRFSPNFIVIDDNIGKSELKNSVQALHRYKKTRSIPITILKNSNYQEAIGVGVLNFILKEQLTGEALYRALTNSIKFLRTQSYLRQTYRGRKGHLLRIIN